MVSAMSNSVTVKLNSKTEARLRQLASEEGMSLEAVVECLLDGISMALEPPPNRLSDAQIPELRERVRNPGPIASPERVAAALAKFRGAEAAPKGEGASVRDCLRFGGLEWDQSFDYKAERSRD